MKKLIIIISLVLIWFVDFAQEGGKVVQTLKGKVINEATNEGISYTNIGLEGTFYGTASNAEGNFTLKIPAEFVSKNIYFSAVGFKNKMFAVETLFDKEFNVVKLESQSYGIDDIDIAAQSKVLIRILRMASENIPVNYLAGPLNLQCSYKNEKTKDLGKKVSTNANALIYDETGYSYPSKEDAFKSRKYQLKKTTQDSNEYRFATAGSSMDELLELDWVRSASSILSPNLIGGFQLKLKAEQKINETECWIISFSQKKPTLAGSNDYYATAFSGEITIGKTDYDIKTITGKIESPKNNVQGKSLAISNTNSNYFENVTYDFSIQYKNLHPENISLNKSYTYKGEKTTENSSLTVKQVNITNLTELTNRDYFIGE